MRRKTKFIRCTLKSLDVESKEILECSLDNTGTDVATTITGYIAKKLSKKSKCKKCTKKLKAGNEANLLHNKYLKTIITWWIKSTVTFVG